MIKSNNDKIESRNVKIRKVIFFDTGFFDTKYFHFIIPIIYFLIMIFVSIFNRVIGDYGVESDFYAGYAPRAKEILNGILVIDPYKGPLYQILLAITGFIFSQDFFLAAKIINVFSASIVLYFVSKIVTSLLNKECAFMATLIISINYTFLTYTYTPDTDLVFLVFYISAIYFILRSKVISCKNFFIAGVLTSLAYLTRYTAISLILFVFLLLVLSICKWYIYKRKSDNIKFLIKLKPFIYFFIPVIIFTTTWGIISYKKTGYFFYNLNYQNTALTVYKPENISNDEWNLKSKENFSSMKDVLFKDVNMVFNKIILNNLPLYLKKDLTRLLPKYFGIFVLVGLLFFIIRFKKNGILQNYYFFASLLFYFQILLIFYAERFSLPILPFYSFIIVWFFSIEFLERFNFKFSNFRLFGILLFGLIIYNFITSYNLIKVEINKGPIEILDIKDWVEKNNLSNLSEKTILSRKPHIAYYLKMKYEVTPFVINYDEYIKNAKNRNVDYVYISEKEAEYITNEELKKTLLNYENPPADLEVVTHTNNPIAILYKVKK